MEGGFYAITGRVKGCKAGGSGWTTCGNCFHDTMESVSLGVQSGMGYSNGNDGRAGRKKGR